MSKTGCSKTESSTMIILGIVSFDVNIMLLFLGLKRFFDIFPIMDLVFTKTSVPIVMFITTVKFMWWFRRKSRSSPLESQLYFISSSVELTKIKCVARTRNVKNIVLLELGNS